MFPDGRAASWPGVSECQAKGEARGVAMGQIVRHAAATATVLMMPAIVTTLALVLGMISLKQFIEIGHD